jgi:hypothetical protein
MRTQPHASGATAAQATPQPTRQQLEMAYRHLRRPNLWPPSLEEALARPHFAAALRALAIRLQRGAAFVPAHAAPPHRLPYGPPVPPTPAALPGTAHSRQAQPLLATAPPAWMCRPPAGRGAAAAARTTTLQPAPSGPDRKRLAANDRD